MLRLEQSFIDTAQKVSNDQSDNVVKKEPNNKWFKKMLNHQRQFQMDMSVYSKRCVPHQVRGLLSDRF